MGGHEAHTAEASSAGVLFQLERALFHLSGCSPDGAVGVETDDDVAVAGSKGGILEQDKLSLQDRGHPFQDRSSGLWNTLLIWLKASTNETLADHELHLVTNRPVPGTCLARRMATATEDDSIAAVVADLHSTAKKNPTKTMTEVLSYPDTDLAQVVRRVRLFDGASGSAGKDLRNRTLSNLHLDPDLDHASIADGLLGWIHDRLQEAWRAGQPGWIARDAFDRQLARLQQVHRQDRLRERAARHVPVTHEQRESKRGNPFVSRLVEVELEGGAIDGAIDDYLRFATERLRLAQEGEIVEPEWESFFDEIRERWRRIHDRYLRKLAKEAREEGSAVEIGREIYFETADNPDYRARLAGAQTEHLYFTSGGYHKLAEQDLVWWHPDHSPGEG